MIYKDLSPNEYFYFGTKEKSEYRRGIFEKIKVPVKWCKTHDNGLAMYVDSDLRMRFDFKNMNGANDYERRNGTRMFPFSNVFRFLNSIDCPYLNNMGYDKAFIENFSEQERSYLNLQTVTMNVPSGYNKRYGKTYTYSCLVNIPFESQLKTIDHEGTFGINPKHNVGWIVDADTLVEYYNYEYVYRCSGSKQQFVTPIISVKDEAPVDQLEDGSYIIRVPEPEFTADLLAFLG